VKCIPTTWQYFGEGLESGSENTCTSTLVNTNTIITTTTNNTTTTTNATNATSTPPPTAPIPTPTPPPLPPQSSGPSDCQERENGALNAYVSL
jgi:hypothetical protein